MRELSLGHSIGCKIISHQELHKFSSSISSSWPSAPDIPELQGNGPEVIPGPYQSLTVVLWLCSVSPLGSPSSPSSSCSALSSRRRWDKMSRATHKSKAKVCSQGFLWNSGLGQKLDIITHGWKEIKAHQRASSASAKTKQVPHTKMFTHPLLKLQYLKEADKKDEERLSSRACCNSTRGNGFKLRGDSD